MAGIIGLGIGIIFSIGLEIFQKSKELNKDKSDKVKTHFFNNVKNTFNRNNS